MFALHCNCVEGHGHGTVRKPSQLQSKCRLLKTIFEITEVRSRSGDLDWLTSSRSTSSSITYSLVPITHIRILGPVLTEPAFITLFLVLDDAMSGYVPR